MKTIEGGESCNGTECHGVVDAADVVSLVVFRQEAQYITHKGEQGEKEQSQVEDIQEIAFDDKEARTLEKRPDGNDEQTKGDCARNRLEFLWDFHEVNQNAYPHEYPETPHVQICLETIDVCEAEHNEIEEGQNAIVLDG